MDKREVGKIKLNEFIGAQQAADFLGVHVNTIKNWARKKKITCFRHPINKHFLYRLIDLEQLFQKMKGEGPK